MRVLLFVCATAIGTTVAQKLTDDIGFIKRHWGQLSPYHDNPENHFGVKNFGLPTGCQVEQVHLLQRHAQRFATGATEDGANILRFASKVHSFADENPNRPFTGSLEFLNTYRVPVDDSGLLTGPGASTEFNSGVNFWNRYGRILYNATQAQLAYNPNRKNGNPKPLLRTTNQSRMWNTQINWALGFFGTSFEETPNPKLDDATSSFNTVIIPEGGTENNTLASYDSCLNDGIANIGLIGDSILLAYLPKYLGPATKRMNQNAPSGFTFTVRDTYAMQTLCAYESAYLGLGVSSFCGFFTEGEWQGFEYSLDLLYYYDYSYGQPTGRAQGIGYLSELLARLQKHYIKSSSTSVNSTLDNNGKTFPLNEPFYADFTHDDIIISVLTALSMDYFHDKLSTTQFPPDANRHFVLGDITPFAGRLVTEVIGCSSANPKPRPAGEHRVQYYPTQYGYDPDNAPNKFIRMRINHGVLPLKDIRGSACKNGRPDGMCAMDDFLKSQKNAEKLSNYQYACFGKYSLKNPTNGHDYDGTIMKP